MCDGRPVESGAGASNDDECLIFLTLAAIFVDEQAHLTAALGVEHHPAMSRMCYSILPTTLTTEMDITL